MFTPFARSPRRPATCRVILALEGSELGCRLVPATLQDFSNAGNALQQQAAAATNSLVTQFSQAKSANGIQAANAAAELDRQEEALGDANRREVARLTAALQNGRATLINQYGGVQTAEAAIAAGIQQEQDAEVQQLTDAVNGDASLAPAAQAQSRVLFADTRQKLEGLTAAAEAQMKSIRGQFDVLGKQASGELTSLGRVVEQRFQSLEQARADLLQAYAQQDSALYTSAYAELNRINSELKRSMDSLQQLLNNALRNNQIVPTSDVQSTPTPTPTTTYSPPPSPGYTYLTYDEGNGKHG